MNAQTKVKADTLASAMAAAFAEIEAATKQANNPHFKSKYADLTAIIDAVKPALVNHSLYFTQHCHPSEDGVLVETVIGHAGGEEKSLGKLFVPANKKDAQGFGSALTYARRYALMTAFAVPTEDDDGNAAAKSVANDTQSNGKVEGITKVKERLRLLKAAGDAFTSLDEFNELLAANREDLAKIKDANHQWWTGDGADFEGFKAWIVRRRGELAPTEENAVLSGLIQSMKQCETAQALTNWMAANETLVAELDGAESRSFQLAYELHESAIKQTATVAAG